MFYVSDNQAHKQKKIVGLVVEEPMIAVLLAAANWEWTVGRCILFFGKSPNVHVRKALEKTHGLEKYKDLWRDEICRNDQSSPSLASVVTNWSEFKYAFDMRHRLIHGRGTCTTKVATVVVAQILTAVSELYAFAQDKGMNLNDRAPIRRKPPNV